MTLAETLAEDYRVLGFSPDGHLLTLFRDALAADGVRPLADLPGLPPGMRVRVADLVQIVQRPPTARGMCFLTLEDETALGNAALRPDVDARYRAILVDMPMVVMEGTLQRVESVTSLLVSRVWPIGA